MEGAHEVGGTKTCTGAAAKQKTAEPQGAAALSLAVLESDGRKRGVPIDNGRRWELGRRGQNTAQNVRSVLQPAIGRKARVRWAMSARLAATFGGDFRNSAENGARFRGAGIGARQCPENEWQKKGHLLYSARFGLVSRTAVATTAGKTD